MYQVVCGMHANLTIDAADVSGVNLEAVPWDEQRANRQLNAGERMLTRVGQEKNNLQDTNI